MQDIDLHFATYISLLNMVKIKRFGGTNNESDNRLSLLGHHKSF